MLALETSRGTLGLAASGPRRSSSRRIDAAFCMRTIPSASSPGRAWEEGEVCGGREERPRQCARGVEGGAHLERLVVDGGRQLRFQREPSLRGCIVRMRLELISNLGRLVVPFPLHPPCARVLSAARGCRYTPPVLFLVDVPLSGTLSCSLSALERDEARERSN